MKNRFPENKTPKIYIKPENTSKGKNKTVHAQEAIPTASLVSWGNKVTTSASNKGMTLKFVSLY